MCGDVLPGDRREQLIVEHGPTVLKAFDLPGNHAAIMRVRRAGLGINLADAKAALHRLLNGNYAGTLPERELPARKLRAADIDAVAIRS